MKKEYILNIHQYLMIKNNKMIYEFIVLLSSLPRAADLTKCLFLNDEPYMVRPTIIDMNPNKLTCYPFMISLNMDSKRKSRHKY